MYPAAFTVKTPQNPSRGAYNLDACIEVDIHAPSCPDDRLGGAMGGKSDWKRMQLSFSYYGGKLEPASLKTQRRGWHHCLLRWNTNFSENVGGLSDPHKLKQNDQRWCTKIKWYTAYTVSADCRAVIHVLVRPHGEW